MKKDMTYSAELIDENNSLVLLYCILCMSAAYRYTISLHTIISIYTILNAIACTPLLDSRA